MSRTKIEQYPNSLMTVSRLIAERNFKDAPPLEKAMKINKIERENFYKDKEKSKDDVDEFINKLVKIDGYITELTVYFDNSEEIANRVQDDRYNLENPNIDSLFNEPPSERLDENSQSTQRTVGSGIRKKKKGRPKLRGGAWEDEYRDDGMTHGAYLELVKLGLAPASGIIQEPPNYAESKKSQLLKRFEERSKSRSSDRVNIITKPKRSRPPIPPSKRKPIPITVNDEELALINANYDDDSTRGSQRLRRLPSSSNSISSRLSSLSSNNSLSSEQARANEAELRREQLALDAEQRARSEPFEYRENSDPIEAFDVFRRPIYRSDIPYYNSEPSNDGDPSYNGDNISEITDDYDRISNKNIGKDKQQITFILVLLTKILEEINAINLFYKSKIFKNYKKISVFDIELINKELIDLYNKWNELLQLMSTYPFLNVKALTNKVNTQFSKLYGLTKQINPSLNINDASKQQFEVSIADNLSKSQNIRRDNIRARRQEVEDELSDQGNWGQRSNDSIDDRQESLNQRTYQSGIY
jgi:hypothetical protein